MEFKSPEEFKEKYLTLSQDIRYPACPTEHKFLLLSILAEYEKAHEEYVVKKDIIQKAVDNWRIFRDNLKTPPEDEIYAFAYWLFTYSGLTK